MPSSRRVAGERSGDAAGRPASFIEPGRLARAVQLAVRRIGPRQYEVRGQKQQWWPVDLDGDPPCYCPDMENRGRAIGGKCKHVVAAMLQERDPRVVNALVERYERQLKILREAGLETDDA